MTVNRETLAGGQSIRGLVVNSGIANAGVGEQGYIDAKDMAVIASDSLGVKPEEVLVFSTGVIGVELPMTLIRSGVEQIELSDDGGNPLARAMMTTDTHPKEVGVTVDIGGTEVHIGGVAKGSGMIHPNMATMLCFVATDAAVDQGLLRQILPEVADYSLNMLTVDGDSSTNDSLVVLANGAAGNPVITAGTPEAEAFKAGLLEVCVQLTPPAGPRWRRAQPTCWWSRSPARAPARTLASPPEPSARRCWSSRQSTAQTPTGAVCWPLWDAARPRRWKRR